jgi:glycosyltransferase involved in cell wall biosynthesis
MIRGDSMSEPFSIVIPIYNEEKSIHNTVMEIKKTLKHEEYEIICVNDCSEDSSRDILENISGIRVISHDINKGYGYSLKSGIKISKYDWILITDADGTYLAKEIPQILKDRDKYDMIVGSRTGKDVNIPFMRRPAKAALNRFSSFLARKEIPDLNSGLRVFRKEIALEYWNLLPEGFSFTSTITMCCLTNGYEVKYCPIDYCQRVGKSSIHPIKDTYRFFKLVSRLALYFNPTRVFMPLSFLFLLFAIGRGIRDFIVVDRIGNFALILFFMSFQTLFFGLIAEIISKRK